MCLVAKLGDHFCADIKTSIVEKFSQGDRERTMWNKKKFLLLFLQFFFIFVVLFVVERRRLSRFFV